jgi:glycosyltransferase involved in cell wall biosynthesis
MILGAFTGLLSNGGVQRAGRLVAGALARRADEDNLAFRFLSLNDPLGTSECQTEAGPVSIEGMGGRKDRMAREIAASAPKTRFFYMIHPNLAPLGLIYRSLNRKAPYIVNTHGIDVWEPLPRLWRFSLGRAQRVACPSRYTAERLVKLQKIPSKRVKVVEWGLEAHFLDAANRRATDRDPSAPPMLLAVSRLAKTEAKKGFEASLQAFASLSDRFPAARFVLAGDGDAKSDLQALASELGVGDRVEFPGAISDQELYELYRRCDVFVMPSIKEGFGLTYLEAAAFGKPSLGGNDGAAPEVVLDGKTGLTAPWNDPEAIAVCLSRFLEDDDFRRDLGQAARERVLENFSFRHFEKRFNAMIDPEWPKQEF